MSLPAEAIKTMPAASAASRASLSAPEVAEQVAKIATQVRGVLLERLGPVVWESSVSKAAFALEELEETAKLWHLAGGRATPLEEPALEDLRATFKARW